MNTRTVISEPSARATFHLWHPEHADPQMDAQVMALRQGILRDHPHAELEFLRWGLSRDNPAGQGFAVTLHRQERMLAFGALCPRQFRYRKQDLTVAFGFDYMVDRGLSSTASGLYAVRIARHWGQIAKARGFAFGLSFPNQNAQGLLLSRHVGWHAAARPRLRVRPIAGPGAIRRIGGMRDAALLAAAWTGNAASYMRGLLRKKDADLDLRELDLENPDDRREIDLLWHKRRDDHAATLVRDAANLRWRYGRHPVHRYSVIGAMRSDGLAGLIVTCRREIDGLPALLIVDGLFDPAAPDLGAALLRDAQRRGAYGGAAIAAAEAIPGTAWSEALAREGFVTVPRRFDPKGFVLTTRPYGDEGIIHLAAHEWGFCWGDIDVV